MCDNLINSLKLLTNQQKDGVSPVDSLVTGLLEKSRKGNMDGFRKFIDVDNHEAVKVGGLRQGINSFQLAKPKFCSRFPRGNHPRRSRRADTESRRRRRTAHLHRHHPCGRASMGASASRRGLACLLPGHSPTNRWTRVGNHVIITIKSCTRL